MPGTIYTTAIMMAFLMAKDGAGSSNIVCPSHAILGLSRAQVSLNSATAGCRVESDTRKLYTVCFP